MVALQEKRHIYSHELNYIIATTCFMPLGQSQVLTQIILVLFLFFDRLGRHGSKY